MKTNELSLLSSRDYNLLVSHLPPSSPLPCKSFFLRFCLFLRMLFCISQLIGSLLPLNPPLMALATYCTASYFFDVPWTSCLISLTRRKSLLRQGWCLAHCIPCSALLNILHSRCSINVTRLKATWNLL